MLGELKSFRNPVLFSRKFQMQFNVLRKREFFDSSLHHIFESENFRFPFFVRKIA